MGDLRCADAKGKGAEGAVGRGVAVAANDAGTGQRQALLRPDDMNDALARIVDVEQPDAVLRRIVVKLLDHPGNIGRGRRVPVAAHRHVVVAHPEGQVRARDSAVAAGDLGKGVM